MKPKITVCVLCYGAYLDLAKRCRGSIVARMDPECVADVRITLAEVCDETRDYVFNDVVPQLVSHAPVDVRLAPNVGKYPLMRRMLYTVGPRPTASLVTWFDDDSYLVDPFQFRDVVRVMTSHREPIELLGSPYRAYGFKPEQIEAIKQQSWYVGREIPRRRHPRFVTGGWWTARMATLRKFDYPFPEIRHNGGDSILGELCHQQGWRIEPFGLAEGVRINYDEKRGGESKAARRGMTSNGPFVKPLTRDEVRQLHDFEVELFVFQKK